MQLTARKKERRWALTWLRGFGISRWVDASARRNSSPARRQAHFRCIVGPSSRTAIATASACIPSPQTSQLQSTSSEPRASAPPATHCEGIKCACRAHSSSVPAALWLTASTGEPRRIGRVQREQGSAVEVQASRGATFTRTVPCSAIGAKGQLSTAEQRLPCRPSRALAHSRRLLCVLQRNQIASSNSGRKNSKNTTRIDSTIDDHIFEVGIPTVQVLGTVVLFRAA